MAVNAYEEGMFMLKTREIGCLPDLPTGKKRCYGDLYKGDVFLTWPGYLPGDTQGHLPSYL